MKINEETTVSEEQVLFNKLSYEEQQFILKQMRMLQPCELSCEIEEKKIPEKLETYKDKNNTIFLDDLCYKYMPIHKDSLSFNEQVIVDKLNEVLDYLKSKGE